MRGEALRFEMCSSLVLAWTFTYPYFYFPNVPCPMRVQPSQAPKCRRVLRCPAASSTPAGPPPLPCPRPGPGRSSPGHRRPLSAPRGRGCRLEPAVRDPRSRGRPGAARNPRQRLQGDVCSPPVRTAALPEGSVLPDPQFLGDLVC